MSRRSGRAQLRHTARRVADLPACPARLPVGVALTEYPVTVYRPRFLLNRSATRRPLPSIGSRRYSSPASSVL